MSLFSTFYSGERQRVLDCIGSTEINESGNISSIDFSGGISRPFLLMDDFDLLLGIIVKDKSEKSFLYYRHEIIQGNNDDKVAESQIFSLKDEFKEAISTATNDDFAEFSSQWNEKNNSKAKSISNYTTSLDDKIRRVFLELTWVAVAIILISQIFNDVHSIVAKVVTTGLGLFVVGLRYAIYRLFQKPSKRPVKNREKHDWSPQLEKLREICINSPHEIIYSWSL